MKKHFKVLPLAQEYSLATQVQLDPALAVLHNFIMIHNPGKVSLIEVEIEQNKDDVWSPT